MKRLEFIRKCSLATNLTQNQVDMILRFLRDEFEDELVKGERVSLLGLGMLSAEKRNGRPIYNFKTGNVYDGKPYYVARYSPSAGVKRKLRRLAEEDEGK